MTAATCAGTSSTTWWSSAHAGAVALVCGPAGAHLPGGRAAPAAPWCGRDRGRARAWRRRVVAPVVAFRSLPGRARDARSGRGLDVRHDETWTLHPATQGDPQYTTVIYLD